MSVLLRLSLSVILVLSVLAAQVQAQDRRDGNYWRTIPETEKLDVILGVFDGMSLSESLVQIVVRDNYTICSEVIDSIMAQTSKYMDNLTTAQISSGLDTFYENEANRRIPIFWGVWVVARQSKGDKNIETFIKELRRAHK